MNQDTQTAHFVQAPSTLTVPQALLSVDSLHGTTFGPAARLYAAAGLHVFPVDPESKAPMDRLRWGTEATRDPARIAAWAARWPTAGTAIACKPSGLLVVDLDVKNDIDGPESWFAASFAEDPRNAPYTDRTTVVRTRSGGQHLWFADSSAIPGRNAAWPGVDVKAAGGEHGGYVVAPPTPGYEALVLHPPMQVPGWLRDVLLRRTEPPPPAERPPAAGSPGRRLVGLVATVLRSEEGGRNSALHWASCRAAEMAAAGEITAEQGQGALIEAAMKTGLTFREATATVRSAFRGAA